MTLQERIYLMNPNHFDLMEEMSTEGCKCSLHRLMESTNKNLACEECGAEQGEACRPYCTAETLCGACGLYDHPENHECDLDDSLLPKDTTTL